MNPRPEMAIGSTYPGRRVHDTDRFAPGDYGKHPSDGGWYANAPGAGLGDLRNHSVLEHLDGTITVTPSILITDNRGLHWHGFLEKGVWRRV